MNCVELFELREKAYKDYEDISKIASEKWNLCWSYDDKLDAQMIQEHLYIPIERLSELSNYIITNIDIFTPTSIENIQSFDGIKIIDGHLSSEDIQYTDKYNEDYDFLNTAIGFRDVEVVTKFNNDEWIDSEILDWTSTKTLVGL